LTIYLDRAYFEEPIKDTIGAQWNIRFCEHHWLAKRNFMYGFQVIS